MKVLKFIGKTLLWILYFLITLKDRNLYLKAQVKGMECVDVSSGLLADTYEYNPRNPPQERNYLTWKQYRKEHNF